MKIDSITEQSSYSEEEQNYIKMKIAEWEMKQVMQVTAINSGEIRLRSRMRY